MAVFNLRIVIAIPIVCFSYSNVHAVLVDLNYVSRESSHAPMLRHPVRYSVADVNFVGSVGLQTRQNSRAIMTSQWYQTTSRQRLQPAWLVLTNVTHDL